MQHIIIAVVVAVAYGALAAISKIVAYAPADAWTVWLPSGAVFGTLLAVQRGRWKAVLAGGFIGATGFALSLGTTPLDALGYGVIEVVTAAGAAFLVSRVRPLPLHLDNARDLAALILAGALPLALIGAGLATAWHVATGGPAPAATFRIWTLSNFIGTLLVAPVVVTWARLRIRRSGGMTMPVFAAGAVACALFLASVFILFDAPPGSQFGGLAGRALTYVPIVFMAIVAVLWGTRGATLAAFVGALIAILNTAQGEGPFAGVEGFLGEPELEVEGYAVAIAMTGLLIAVLAAAQRNAMRVARDWQTRFEAAIGAHRLLAYEWDPVSGQMAVTGDSAALVGVPAAGIGTLADWIALAAADDRERVSARFEARAQGSGDSDVLRYHVNAPGGAPMTATDEARVIRDHDGQLHRVVGIVRVSPLAESGARA
ncbi:MAG: MASE1 domain-containing protein [Casimicrobiaceae bacterium]